MLTGTHGVVAAPLQEPVLPLPTPLDFVDADVLWEERAGESASTALLRARTMAIGPEDPVGQLRALLDLAYAELDDDSPSARVTARHSLQRMPHAVAANALVRALSVGREPEALEEQLQRVESLASHVSEPAAHADFVVEMASLLELKSGPSSNSKAAFEAALALAPAHPRALFGLERTLEALECWPEFAALLGRVASLASEPNVAAWFHVERAWVLDRRLGDTAAAWAALERALELAPQIGLVRQAAVDHAVLHRDQACLGALLESESALETDDERKAILVLDGALAYLAAGDRERAIRLLERAEACPRRSSIVGARVATELAKLLEAEGRLADALRVRKTALSLMSEPRAELVALREAAAVAERAGETTEAVLLIERARVLDADDPTLLDELDRLLVVSKRQETRAVLWMRESALADEPHAKARALLTAAEAATAAGRDADAARYREAAWLADPEAPGVFDAFAERLAPALTASTKDAVKARVALYERAAERASELGKRVHYLEKIAWLADDVLDDPARAAESYERVLALEPTRRSAIAALASAAARAHDARKLSQALLAEANVTEEATARDALKLRASQVLSDVEPERALVLAEELARSGVPGARAVVTRLHASGGRWTLVADTLAARRAEVSRPSERISLLLAEAAVHTQHLASPAAALQALEAAEGDVGDPAIEAAILSSYEQLGDVRALAAKLEAFAETTHDPQRRALHLLRASEIAEHLTGREEEAVRLCLLAREVAPTERLVVERLRRLGARVAVPSEYGRVSDAAMRSLEREDGVGALDASAILQEVPRDFAVLRLAERVARRARSAPQLANALALEAEVASGLMAERALSGLAQLILWVLPDGGDLRPWDALLELGCRDAVTLDDLLARARPKLRDGDGRAQSVAIRALSRRLEVASDDTERVVLRSALARWQLHAGSASEAAVNAAGVLDQDANSLGAALVLAEAARVTGDRMAAVRAAVALAGLVHSPPAQASLLCAAADLVLASGDPRHAAMLLERALDANPEGIHVAARLALIQRAAGAYEALARALRRALAVVASRDAVVPIAAELADVARTQLRDPLMAIDALERSRAVAPGHVPTLLILSELYIGQRAWNEALVALGDVVSCSNESSEKLVALVGRASILARVLERPAEAADALRAALAVDAHDERALRGLLALRVSLEPRERAELLARLTVASRDPKLRHDALLELVQLRSENGDPAGAERALVEAAALVPSAAMLARLHEVAAGDPASSARLISRAVSRIREGGGIPDVGWLVNLGEIELSVGRTDAALERFEEALEREPQNDSARFGIARALAATGQNARAAEALFPFVAGGAFEERTLVPLDEALTNAGRLGEALFIKELRELGGLLDPAGRSHLRARRYASLPADASLSSETLRRYVMPSGFGSHAFWGAAATIGSMAGKLARVPLASYGVTSKDRIRPKAVHPLRQLLDRLVSVFALSEAIELAVSEHATAPAIACEDAPWVVVPSFFADLPESQAMAELAKPLASLALGVPWFDALAVEETVAIVAAVAQHVAPSSFGWMHSQEYETRVRRAMDRRRRKGLEDMHAELESAPRFTTDAFRDAVLRTQERAALLLSGDLRASLGVVAMSEPSLRPALRSMGRSSLEAISASAAARNLVMFALSSEASALRRRIGTVWHAH